MVTEQNYLKKELYDLIKQDESIFDFLQESSLDGLWYWDLESPDSEWMSPEFWKTLGIDPATKRHLASEWQDLIHPDDLKVAISNFEKHLENPEHPYDQIVRYTHDNGSTVWVRCRGLAIRNDEGKPIRMLGAHNDITKLKEIENRYEKNLRALDELYATTKVALEESSEIFNKSPDATLQVDDQGYIVRANDAASDLFGYSVTELTEMNVDLLVPDQYRHNHINHRKDYSKNPSIRPMGTFRKGINAKHKDGHEIPVEIRLGYISTRYGRHVLATIRDISEYQELISSLEEQVRANETLELQATTDSLTSLHNRRYFEDVGGRALTYFKRHKTLCSLMLIDIDHFKSINDVHGHSVGDMVLTKIADSMLGVVRNGDTLARIGGEEFAMLLPVTSSIATEILADRLRKKIENSSFVDCGIETPITISIGIAEFTSEDHDLKGLMERADHALYYAKEHGRNRVVSYADIVEECAL